MNATEQVNVNYTAREIAELEAEVMDTILECDRRERVLVSLREIRKLTALNKTDFDAGMLSLIDKGKVMPHRYDHPQVAPQATKDAMVTDGTNWYIGIVVV